MRNIIICFKYIKVRKRLNTSFPFLEFVNSLCILAAFNGAKNTYATIDIDRNMFKNYKFINNM